MLPDTTRCDLGPWTETDPAETIGIEAELLGRLEVSDHDATPITSVFRGGCAHRVDVGGVWRRRFTDEHDDGSGGRQPSFGVCVAQGGTVEIVDEAGGQVGYCNLPDGSRVEEWEYFRAQTGSTVEP